MSSLLLRLALPFIIGELGFIRSNVRCFLFIIVLENNVIITRKFGKHFPATQSTLLSGWVVSNKAYSDWKYYG